MDFKYVRIQGRELSYVTKYPKGILAMCRRKIYDGVMEEADAELFKEMNKHPYDVVYMNFVGDIVYEDEYQVAVRV